MGRWGSELESQELTVLVDSNGPAALDAKFVVGCIIFDNK
jgi:hypothetical protein